MGLYQTQAKLEHSIFAVELSLNVHYSTKFGSFTALDVSTKHMSRYICSTLAITTITYNNYLTAIIAITYNKVYTRVNYTIVVYSKTGDKIQY